MQFGIDELTVEKLKEVFNTNPNIDEVIIYGSRAKGSKKYMAKVELALKGNHIAFTDLLKLEVAITRLKLDYKTTLNVLNLVSNAELRDHILAFGQTFYSKKFADTATV